MTTRFRAEPIVIEICLSAYLLVDLNLGRLKTKTIIVYEFSFANATSSRAVSLEMSVHIMGKTSVPCIVSITCRHLVGTPDSISRRYLLSDGYFIDGRFSGPRGSSGQLGVDAAFDFVVHSVGKSPIQVGNWLVKLFALAVTIGVALAAGVLGMGLNNISGSQASPRPTTEGSATQTQAAKTRDGHASEGARQQGDQHPAEHGDDQERGPTHLAAQAVNLATQIVFDHREIILG